MTAKTPQLHPDFLELAREGVGAAVSGGGDSMALLHLLRVAGVPVRVATVNHNLRNEAVTEARAVADYCASHDIAHTTLNWHWDGTGNLQDHARRARYGLLATWAKDAGLSHVALGHTADDNVETFVMGLSRGAGLDGLSGMRRRFAQGAVSFHRPLLDHWRADLRGILREAGEIWADDPSNDDTKYHRVQVRQALVALEQAGVSSAMMATSVGHLSATRAQVSGDLVNAMRGRFRLEAGELCFDLAWLDTLSPEARRRLIGTALRFVSGQDYPPRAEKLQRVLGDLRAKGTLHGCLIIVRDGELRIGREFAAVAELRNASHLPWDRRWQFTGPHAATTETRALGEAGLAQCTDYVLSRVTLLASPSVWDGDVLLAAPMAGFHSDWVLRPLQEQEDFASSILSH